MDLIYFPGQSPEERRAAEDKANRRRQARAVRILPDQSIYSQLQSSVPRVAEVALREAKRREWLTIDMEARNLQEGDVILGRLGLGSRELVERVERDSGVVLTLRVAGSDAPAFVGELAHLVVERRY